LTLYLPVLMTIQVSPILLTFPLSSVFSTCIHHRATTSCVRNLWRTLADSEPALPCEFNLHLTDSLMSYESGGKIPG